MRGYILKVIEVDGILSELRGGEKGERSTTRLPMFSLRRDIEAHFKVKNKTLCPFCDNSEDIIVIE